MGMQGGQSAQTAQIKQAQLAGKKYFYFSYSHWMINDYYVTNSGLVAFIITKNIHIMFWTVYVLNSDVVLSGSLYIKMKQNISW